MAGSGMDTIVSPAELVLRLALSLVFGALIGLDREAQRKPAGLRTHMMVSLGAASFMLVTIELVRAAAADGQGAHPDPTRIIEGVTAGIGFLGGGTIIQSRGSVEGVTTAAGLWVVGAIGVACGGGHYLLATTTAIFAFTILSGLTLLDRRAQKTT